MIPVEGNGNIRAIGYDPAHQQLHIQFAAALYVFDEVPQTMYECMIDAKSKGSYFHENVKGKYPHRKVEPEPSTTQ